MTPPRPPPYSSPYPYAATSVPSPVPSVYSQSASIATPESMANVTWYLDSGASSHVTPEFQNLMHSSPYHVADQLHVQNGQRSKHLSHWSF